MRRFITLFFLIFTLSGVAVAQQMSDDQVVQYVKDAQKMGKTQKQITTELMRRGVTKEQVERIQENMKMEVAVPVHRTTRTQQGRVRVLSKMMKVITLIALKKSERSEKSKEPEEYKRASSVEQPEKQAWNRR